ncbi:sphingomyelin phosphodiesterase-like [Cylas formicarius]|uniref:sphingomyelin phosphodiesterase-like n=1 Tax=Cylas formicarius TaxID=197179 RepID=UPI002958CC9D|nr:sphingomyelin phosphodiesterase-like [Cylas formicarius]
METLKLILVFSVLIGPGSFHPRSGEIKVIRQGYTEYLASGVIPEFMRGAVAGLQLPGIFRDDDKTETLYAGLFSSDDDDDDDDNYCTLCATMVDFLIAQRRAGVSRDSLAREVVGLCVEFGIENAGVCEGTVDLNIDIFVSIVDKHPELTGGQLCGIRFENKGCVPDNKTAIDWEVDIPPLLESAKRKVRGQPGTIKILHISDLHYDPMYTANKTNVCGEPICCQSDQPEGNVVEGTACGYWGDYTGADAPWRLFQAVTDQLRTHDYDLVYFTGDVSSHRTWSTSVSDLSRDFARVFDALKETFDVPVFSVVGNHEPNPANTYYFGDDDESTFSTRWLYELAVEKWSDWLPGEARQTLLRGGFYTVSPLEGFRVVVLNNNVAHDVNWWLIDSVDDPYEQLAWLVEVLKEAEDKGETVHLLSHFPSGKGVLKVWSREYNKIVRRFADTIAAQFNGHSHYDQFVVYYDTKDDKDKPVGVAFNGASLTTLEDVNPSYKIYAVDAESYVVDDFEEWTFNLTDANTHPDTPPAWFKLYSFKEAYGVERLAPVALNDLLHLMARNHSLLTDYHRYRFRNSDPALRAGCDAKCQKKYLCEMSTSRVDKKSHCKELKALYDENA